MTLDDRIVHLNHLVPPDIAGGKATGLSRLADRGLPIPPGVAVTAEAFMATVAEQFEKAGRIAAGVDITDGAALEAVSERARALLGEVRVDHAVLRDVRAAYHELAGADGPVAVRSSAVGEDGAVHSFAGGHDSYLGVRGDDAVVAALLRCWASLFTARAIAYRARAGLAPRPMGVVIQQMVDARASGVLMTLNPVNGDRSTVTVEGVWGLCDPLVSGAVTPDRYFIDRITGQLRRQEIAVKTARAVAGREGMRFEAVAPELVDAPALDQAVLARLHRLTRALESCVGGPADAEFAVDDELWLLQVRPETYWSSRRRPRATTPASALDAVVSALTTTS